MTNKVLSGLVPTKFLKVVLIICQIYKVYVALWIFTWLGVHVANINLR